MKNKKMIVIAGNCVLEELGTTIKTAEFLEEMSREYNFDFWFKASYRKDNRSSLDSYQGVDLDTAQDHFTVVKQSHWHNKRRNEIKTLTDVHQVSELDHPLWNYIDMIQIPAYLCMQTSLMKAVAKKRMPTNIKKGQFLSYKGIATLFQKFIDAQIQTYKDEGLEWDAEKPLTFMTERGTCFGYNDLIFDPRSIFFAKRFASHWVSRLPILTDVGHLVRHPGFSSNDFVEGGSKEHIITIARSAIACGSDGIFVEVHPSPCHAKCDAATQIDFDEFRQLIEAIMPIWKVVQGQYKEFEHEEE